MERIQQKNVPSQGDVAGGHGGGSNWGAGAEECQVSWSNLGTQWLYLGLSENGVPLNPMVNDHYPY